MPRDSVPSAGDGAPPPDPSVVELQGALHDVANALTVVLGWLEVAQGAPGLDPHARRAVELARSRALHGRDIALRAMGAAKHSLDADSATTAEAFASLATAGVEPQASGRGIHVSMHVDEAAPTVAVASPVCAMQVLTNLLLNAVGFTPQGAAVMLDVTCQGDRVRFLVRDEGPGFTPEQKQHVFEGLPSTRENGFGIGLRHAYQVTVREGGTLRLLDMGPGAAFELLWPCSPAPQPATAARTRTLQGKRILVLEDDQAVAMLLETALEARGASVAVTHDESMVMSILGTASYDAALVDLSPLHDPETALATLRQVAPNTRMVLITGCVKAPGPGVLAQVHAWVRKPFEIGEVVEALLGAEP